MLEVEPNGPVITVSGLNLEKFTLSGVLHTEVVHSYKHT